LAVCEYLFETPGNLASVPEIVAHLHGRYDFTEADRERSRSRPNEQVWQQQVRNIIGHRTSAGNFVREGYLQHQPGYLALTPAGAALLGGNEELRVKLVLVAG